LSIDETARRAWDPAGAASYDRGRPGYAPGALGWLVRKGVLGPGRCVVDVGAGTGKLTRQLMLARARVVAVEPLPAMRARLPPRLAVGGVAEALPVASGWAELVTVAQAFHWFRPAEAAAEIARVLQPRGWLALLWNDEAKEADWPDLDHRLKELLAFHGIVTPPGRAKGAWQAEFDASGLFSPWEERQFKHSVESTLDTLVDQLGSYSRLAAQPLELRERILREAAALIAAHPVMGGRRQVLVPYRTTLMTCTRR
jgi:SAM-dependent methyltransferase